MFDQNDNEPERRPKRPASRNPLVWIVVITLIIIFITGAQSISTGKEMDLSELWKMAEEGRVKTITISNDSVTAEMRPGEQVDSKIVVANSDKGLMEKHIDRCAELMADKSIDSYTVASESKWLPILMQWLVPLIIFFLLIFCVFAILAYGLGLQNSWVPFAFITGGFFSGLAGFFGMKTATFASARVTQAASESLDRGLKVAFRAGSVMGMTVVGLAG